MANAGMTHDDKMSGYVSGEQWLQNAVQWKLAQDGFSNVQTLPGMPLGGGNRPGSDIGFISWKDGANYLVLGDNKDWKNIRSNMEDKSQIEDWVKQSLTLYPEADVIRFYLSSTTSEASEYVDQTLKQDILNRILAVANGRDVEVESIYAVEMEQIAAQVLSQKTQNQAIASPTTEENLVSQQLSPTQNPKITQSTDQQLDDSQEQTYAY